MHFKNIILRGKCATKGHHYSVSRTVRFRERPSGNVQPAKTSDSVRRSFHVRFYYVFPTTAHYGPRIFRDGFLSGTKK